MSTYADPIVGVCILTSIIDVLSDSSSVQKQKLEDFSYEKDTKINVDCHVYCNRNTD
jgi:hypothetical protein